MNMAKQTEKQAASQYHAPEVEKPAAAATAAVEVARVAATVAVNYADVRKALRAALPLHEKHHNHEVIGLIKNALAILQ